MRALKIISDLLPIPSYTVILICFFFPFITIKCGTTELVSVTGFDYVVGTDMKEKMKNNEFAKKLEKEWGQDMFDSSSSNLDSLSVDEAGEPKKANNVSLSGETAKEKRGRIMMMFMMGIPFAIAIVGLILSFVKMKRKGLIHIVLSSIGFAIMLIFGIMIKSSDELNAVSSMTEGMGGGMITMGMGTAYYIATILFLLVIMFFGMQKYLKNLYKEEQAIREEALDEFLTKE